MVEIKKGHNSFVEFLDRELSAVGLSHWYEGADSYSTSPTAHHIGRVQEIKRSPFLKLLFKLLFLSDSKRRTFVAEVTREPDSPLWGVAKGGALRITVKNPEALPVLQRLAEKFEQEFDMKAEIVY